MLKLKTAIQNNKFNVIRLPELCCFDYGVLYCANCGQKTITHRYSIKHFRTHVFIHGVWHIDKDILFTLKGLFMRLGKNVREFIQGKSVPYLVLSFLTGEVFAIINVRH
jgi:hypothetical protein